VSIIKKDDKDKKKLFREERRKNSFVFHITKFVTHNDSNYDVLYRLYKNERDQAILRLQKNNRDASKFVCQYRNCLISLVN
jgi:hypothetical protein